MIIAFTGEKLAGKTTATQYLADTYQASNFRFSQPLSDILQRLGQENTRANLVIIGEKLREAFGNDILGQILRKDINQSAAEHKIIDGLRYMEEYSLLKDLPSFKLVYITASLEARYERTKGRSEKADEAAMSFEEFSAKENDSTELGIQELKQHADAIIHNDGTLEEFYKQVDALLHG